jgi:hypothetical protein
VFDSVNDLTGDTVGFIAIDENNMGMTDFPTFLKDGHAALFYKNGSRTYCPNESGKRIYIYDFAFPAIAF